MLVAVGALAHSSMPAGRGVRLLRRRLLDRFHGVLLMVRVAVRGVRCVPELLRRDSAHSTRVLSETGVSLTRLRRAGRNLGAVATAAKNADEFAEARRIVVKEGDAEARERY